MGDYSTYGKSKSYFLETEGHVQAAIPEQQESMAPPRLSPSLMRDIKELKPDTMATSPPAADPHHQGDITMTLEKSDLWRSFHDIGTEMIITKHGRRMFPHCNVCLSGLQHYTNYVLIVEMIPVDTYRYKWNKGQWDVAGKAEPQLPCRTYVHPDSPAPGSYWMKQSVSFLKIKLTNNTLDQHGHIILHSMHRYIPRFYVVQTDSLHSAHWGHFHAFSFPETSFTAVTAYQNTKIAKLKIDHNPFAKGFKGENSRTHSKRCRPNQSQGNNTKRAKQVKDQEYKSPPDLQRAKLELDPVEQRVMVGGTGKESVPVMFSSWTTEQDPSQGQSLHTDLLELHEHKPDYSSEEQMVPGHSSRTFQPYRSAVYGRLPSPSPARSFHATDVATVPGHDATRRDPVSDTCHRYHPMAPTMSQDYKLLPDYKSHVHLPVSSKTYPGSVGYGYPLHGHYSADPGMGQWGEGSAGRYPGQYSPHLPFLTSQTLTTNHSTSQRGSYQPGNSVSEWSWSQYLSLDNEADMTDRPQ
ncbi:hypothetical protein DPEC_G00324010 [Dallia pectoralis]|uniref:Uncharacterized protein n=1 Tax=Dallia pectoralis TaxID=75939 RepID=A0ACC2FAU6_DALPE|nr:hypothetical protein DPEC_G00324010 [Dallia pectoralis]